MNLVQSPGQVWCDLHGWCGHITPGCKGIPYGSRRPRATSSHPGPVPVPPPVPPTVWPSLPSLPQPHTTQHVSSASPPYYPVPQVPKTLKIRNCIYCDSVEHPRWLCPRISKEPQRLCFLCGGPNHRSGVCPNAEFDQRVIDQNYERFILALSTKQAFVPLQEEPPEVAILSQNGTFTTT